MKETPAQDRASGAPWGRLAVTVLLPLLLWLLPTIALPGVDFAIYESVIPKGAKALPSETQFLGIFALGLAPYMSASILVEFVALAVPNLRRLRHGGPSGRRKLGLATVLLTLVLAAFQAFGISSMLAGLGASAGMSVASPWIIIATLVAGTFLLGFFAETITHYGLAGGLSVLTATIPVFAIVDRVRTPSDGRSASIAATDVALFVVFAAIVAIATGFLLRDRKASSPTGERGPQESSIVPIMPSSGIAPLAACASLLSLPVVLITAYAPLRTVVSALHDDGTFRAVSVVLIAALGVGLAWANNLPANVARLARRATKTSPSVDVSEGAVRAALRSATLLSLCYLVFLFAIGQVANLAIGFGIGVPAIALATAVALDAFAEFRARQKWPDLVVVWPDHRPYAVAPARVALEESGIPLFARNEKARRLLQFFGPWAPIDLMVPAADAKRATALFEEVLMPRDADTNEPSRSPIKAGFTRTDIGMAAAFVVFAVGVPVVLPRAAPPAPVVRKPARPDALSLMPLDDDVDAFKSENAELPRGVRVLDEIAPAGPGKSRPNHFARMTTSQGESMEQTRVRFLAWVETLPVPQGERLLLGEVEELNEQTDHWESIGWRTYLAKNEIIVDGSSVESAATQRANLATGLEGFNVSIELNKGGAEKFRAFTAAHAGRRLAIVVDGKVMSAPVILGEIGGGQMQITMGAGEPDKQHHDADRLVDDLMGRKRK